MLVALQQNIPYRFQQVKLLQAAMTHTSAANEKAGGAEHNERLEFLGDAVLELCISKELYRRFSDAREGELTAMRSQLVNQTSLASIARKLGIDKCLLLGKGEEAQGGRKKDTLLSDAVEAMLGAVFLDGGNEAAEQVVASLFKKKWETLNRSLQTRDYKSRLQEIIQTRFKDRPVYNLLGNSGPEHAKEFIVALRLPDGTTVEATGTSVKRAEQQAACAVLEMLETLEQTKDNGSA